jgi:hypothetical protein
VSPDPTRLNRSRSSWLIVARATWVAVAALALGLTIFSVPARFGHLRRLARPTEDALREYGLSAGFYATYIVTISLIFIAIYFVIAGVIFWRRSNDRVALLVSLMLITFGIGESSIADGLVANQPIWHWPIEAMQAFGVGSSLVLFYVFPDGRFVSRWMRGLTVIWVVLILIWLRFPTAPFNPLYSEPWQPNPLPPFLMTLAWFGTGTFAQIYRYLYVATPVQRLQTKWIVFGFTAGYLAGIVRFLPPALFPALRQPGLPYLVGDLITLPIAALLATLFPLSIAFSILRYRLWDIDLIINLTLVYTLLSGSLGLIYIGSIGLCQRLTLTVTKQASLTDGQTAGVLLASTLLIAALFGPWRRRLQTFIDRRFYREKVDFQQAFANFSHEIRLIIELPELLRALVNRITDLFHISYGALLLYEDSVLRLAEVRDVSSIQAEPLVLDGDIRDRLQNCEIISRPQDRTFPLLLPLTAPKVGGSELIGVLALGPRRSEQPYAREDQDLLAGLAEQAGTAIAVAQLIEVERRLETYRNSPMGRAEAAAKALLAQPETALIELQCLAQKAGQDAGVASLMNSLPQALDTLEARPLARIAEGLNYIVTSQLAPEMLTFGLRTLISQLESSGSEVWLAAAESLAIYRVCQMALDADTIAQITGLLPRLAAPEDRGGAAQSVEPVASSASVLPRSPTQATYLVALARSLADLRPVAERLHAYERVGTREDQLFYLAQAVECLGQCHRQRPSDLALPEQLIVQRIVERWTSAATEELQALHGRAQLEIKFITRQVVAADQVTLALEFTNLGRGPATNIVIELMPGEGYRVIEGQATIEQLLRSQPIQRQFVVQPTAKVSFQPYFRVSYDDRERSGKIQTFSTAVDLLPVSATFTPIPNPYAPGAPLRPGSPVFFGRDDLFQFIAENIGGLTRQNILVLIGQRRIGKTSFLQQLPACLGNEYLPVYVDGQALGIDPGMANFFYDLALTIADTLADQSIAMAQPAPEAFKERPTGTFERAFLPAVFAAIGQRQLLLLFDEFEELELRVAAGKLEPTIFSYFRHLMQHSDRLGFVFVGTHRLEQLTADYWSIFFNIALYKHVTFLNEAAARALIRAPVVEYGLIYDDLALDKMLRITAGHPYFLQLICHALVNHANRARRGYLSIQDVNDVLGELLELGEAHFAFLWEQSSPSERLVLASLTLLIHEGSSVAETQIAQLLTQQGVAVEKRQLTEALQRLVERDILREVTGQPPRYEHKIELVRLWVERHKALGRGAEE